MALSSYFLYSQVKKQSSIAWFAGFSYIAQEYVCGHHLTISVFEI